MRLFMSLHTGQFILEEPTLLTSISKICKDGLSAVLEVAVLLYI